MSQSQPSLFSLPGLTVPDTVRLTKAESPVRRERRRRNGTAMKVLERLKQGPATTPELNEIAFRFGGRIHELRKQGWDITTETQDDGMALYTLRGLKK